MTKYRNRSIAVIAALALVISMIPAMAFGASKTVKAVTGLEVYQMSNTSAELDWNYVNGSEGYKVYKATSKTGKYTLVKTIKRGKKTSYTAKNLKLGNTYYFKIKAVDTVYGKKVLSSKSVSYTHLICLLRAASPLVKDLRLKRRRISTATRNFTSI